MSNAMNSKTVRFCKGRCAREFGLKCYFCDKPFSFEELTLEHLIPTARGGSHRSLENHALACALCNNEKGSLTIEEYCKFFKVDVSRFNRRGLLRAGVSEIGPITNHEDLVRIAQLR